VTLVGLALRPSRKPRSLPVEHEPCHICRPGPPHRPANGLAGRRTRPMRLISDLDFPMGGDPHAPAPMVEHLRLAAGTPPAAAGARSVGRTPSPRVQEWHKCRQHSGLAAGTYPAAAGARPVGLQVRECNSGTSARGTRSRRTETTPQPPGAPSVGLQVSECKRPVECKRGLSDGITSCPRYADLPAGPRPGRLRRTAG